MTGFTVSLYRRVVLSDAVAFDARREIQLPFAPFVGLALYRVVCVPDGCDGGEDTIAKVLYDVMTGTINCDLEPEDFRPESSGSTDWTEADVREHYRDWVLTRDEGLTPPHRSTGPPGADGRSRL